MTVNSNAKPVINVTARAAENVLNVMADRALDGHYLRVFVAGIACSGLQYGLAFSREPRDGDTFFESNGIRVLVDPASLMVLHGAIVDYVDSPEGADFTIENPGLIQDSSCAGCKSCE